MCCEQIGVQLVPEHQRPGLRPPQRALRVERDEAPAVGQRRQHLGPEIAAALCAGMHPRRAGDRGRGPARDVVRRPGDADVGQLVVALAVLAVAQHALHDARVELQAERRGELGDRLGQRRVVAARGDAGPHAERRQRARREHGRPARAAHGRAAGEVDDVPDGRSDDGHAHSAAGYGREGA